MEVDRFETLQQLFLEASELSSTERSAWLESRCGSDQALTNELRELLRFHDWHDTPLDAGAAHTKTYRNALVEYVTGDEHTSLVIPGYRIQWEIARGGQTVVYEGVQLSTSQRVAIKILLAAEFSSAAERHGQDREVRVLATLQHPHIVGIIDRGRTESGVQFVVLPFIDGRPLDDHLRSLEHARQEENHLKTLLQLFVKLARAVGVAHRCGVVHLDLKPGNIFIDQHGEPRILDFGLARILSLQSEDETRDAPDELTATGSFIGTLAWASPEQAAGNAQLFGPHTDVYALAVILFQMLTGGQFPYDVAGHNRDVLDNILHAVPKPPSDICSLPDERNESSRTTNVGNKNVKSHPAVDAIVLKALAKSPGDRYEDANALAGDVERYLAGKPTIASPNRAISRAAVGKWSKGRVLLVLGLAAALVLGVLAVRGPRSPKPGVIENLSSVTPVRSWTFLWQVKDIACVPESSQFFHAGWEAPIEIIDWRTGVKNSSANLVPNRDRVTDIEIDSEGTVLLAVPFDQGGGLYAWNAAKSQDLRQVLDQPTHWVHSIPGTSEAVASFPDEFSPKIVDLADGRTVRDLPSGRVCAVSTNGLIAIGRDDETILIKHLNPRDYHLLDGPHDVPHDLAVSAVAFSNDSRLVASGFGIYYDWINSSPPEYRSCCIRIWDAKTRTLLKQLSGHTTVVSDLSFSSDSRYLASASWDGSVKLWSVESGKLMKTIDPHPNTHALCRFTPGGEYLLTGHAGARRIYLWSLASLVLPAPGP